MVFELFTYSGGVKSLKQLIKQRASRREKQLKQSGLQEPQW